MEWFSEEHWSIIALSLKVALWAATLSLPFALWMARFLSTHNGFAYIWLEALVHLPLVLPPVVTGYVLLILFGKNGFLGKPLLEIFGIQLAFRWQGAVLAAAIMAFPLMLRAIRLSYDALDMRLHEAASTLGAHPWRIFYTITLPLIAPGLLAGWILAFARSLGEFGATITFSASIPNQTETISAAIYTLMQIPDQEKQVLSLILFSVLISLIALVASEILARRFKYR